MNTAKTGKVLVVDDDPDVLYTARMALKEHFGQVEILEHPASLPALIEKSNFDVILLDMNFEKGATSGQEGLEWLETILRLDPKALVLLSTAYADINLAVKAIKQGAVDFLVKPWTREQLVATVQATFELSKARQEVSRLKGRQQLLNADLDREHPEIMSRSVAMKSVLEAIEKVAPTDANVLILGENGTGKELVAWAIHKRSARQKEAFIHVDLGAIPETLFEAELFGHVKGAFTDAREERIGRFEAANGGTLFLDEIGNLSLTLQAKLLTAIQNKEIIRIGSNRRIPIDIRLISATNKPLYQMAEEFSFRQDLLYRLNTVELYLPPLRERKEDIYLLATCFLKRFSEKYGKKDLIFQEATLAKLREYHWPGNIRELQHAIERAVIMSEGPSLVPMDFCLNPKLHENSDNNQYSKVEDYERMAIRNALRKFEGNLTRAAHELGIGRSTIYRKMKKLGI